MVAELLDLANGVNGRRLWIALWASNEALCLSLCRNEEQAREDGAIEIQKINIGGYNKCLDGCTTQELLKTLHT